MRGKEEAHDYRYFPDPDLLPVVVDDAWLAAIRREMPELPDARQKRYIDQYGLSVYDASRLAAERRLGDYFEACLAEAPGAKPTANWILGELMAWLNAENRTIDQSPVAPEHLGQLLTLIDQDVISGKIAKTVFEEMIHTGQDPRAIVDAKGLVQVSDASALEAVVAGVLAAAPDEVAAYRQGKQKLMGFFVGQVMRETRGQANPKLVNAILQRLLSA
jgi:aspartyl-tRNA(Asn)/glutamyl-tRNA(Gln) amidotransferase subunit B